MNSDDNILYHYTSLEVFKCMFDNYTKENPYLTFWASNCAFMNDPREISEGIDLIKDALYDISCPLIKERANNILSNDNLKEMLLYSSTLAPFGIPYAISFSRVKDNINMWRMYGDSGKGIAMGFKRESIHVQDCELCECFYPNEDIEAHIGVIRQLLEDYFAKYSTKTIDGISQNEYDLIRILQMISPISARIKNDVYSYEKESRLIKNSREPFFRVANNILIPYVTIQIPIEALDNILIGPDCNTQNINSLRVFFSIERA